MDITDGYHPLKDGDAWRAVGPDFVDVQRSPTDFGATEEEAARALHAELRRAGYPDSAIPRFRDIPARLARQTQLMGYYWNHPKRCGAR